MMMAVIHPPIFEIIQRFPEQRSDIISLHNNSQTFRSMCEDFRRCKEAYRHWSQSESENSSPRSEEYRELLENLDSEISQYIMENPMKVDKRKKPVNLQS